MISEWMKNSCRPVFVLLWLISLSFTTQAAEEIKDLYLVTLPVASQAKIDRQRVLTEGLETLFVRVSGNKTILENQAVKSVLRRPETFLKQFSYRQVDDPEGAQSTLLLNMRFERSLIESLLRAEGLPLWPANRPTVLAWLVVDTIDGRQLVAGSFEKVTEPLMAHAKRRGLSIKLPSLDLEDAIAISVDDVWGLNTWVAKQATKRYKLDSLLLGKMTQLSTGKWLGSWVFDDNGTPYTLDTEADDLDSFLSQGVDFVADKLAQSYAIVPMQMSDQGVVMRLTGVEGVATYARAIQYLESLAAVRYANPIHVEPGLLLVQLVADGQLSQLEQALALGKRLQKIPPLEFLAAKAYPSIQLHYHWPANQ